MIRRVQLLPALLVLLASVSSTAQPPDPAALGPQGPTSSQGVVTRPGRPSMPPRDGTPSTEPGTAKIRGRVTDENGQALRRASVSIFGRSARQPRMALTDADGRFEITELAAGHYQASASKGGYVRLAYGQRTTQGIGRPLELVLGQTLDKIDFVLPRGGVIAGRVVDELGEPVAEAQVSTLRYMTINGSRRLGPAGGRGAQTDDLGQFRLYGLSPGEYYVSAQVRSPMFAPAGIDPGPSDGSGYAPTFAPGTPSVAEATRFTVQAGQEVTTEIQLTVSRLLRVTGTVVTSTGRPAAGGFVRLAPKGDVMMGGFGPGSGGPIGEGGAFVITQVPPGPYVLTARTGSGEDAGFGTPRRGGQDDSELALLPLTVAGDDLVGVRVVTGRGLTVPGIVVAEGAALPTDPALQVMAFPSEPEAGLPGARSKPVQADGRFQLEGVFGESRVQMINVPRGWMIKSIIYNGADVTDKPADFTTDQGPVRIVITNRLTVLTGTVSRNDAVTLTDYAVLVFSADPARWRSMSTMRVVRPNDQGVYRIEALAPGDYHVAAFDVAAYEAVDEETRGSNEFRERIRSLAQQAELTDGQTRTLNLKLSTLPQ